MLELLVGAEPDKVEEIHGVEVELVENRANVWDEGG